MHNVFLTLIKLDISKGDSQTFSHGGLQSHRCRNPSLGLATKAKGLQGCEPRRRKPGSQSKGIARVRDKRKPGSHITYSQEC